MQASQSFQPNFGEFLLVKKSHRLGPQVMLAAIRTELKAIRRQLRESARLAEHWKARDVATQPVMGLGFFSLALGLPMLLAGLAAKTPIAQASNLVFGGFLLFVGYLLLSLPTRLWEYFLMQSERMYSFFAELDQNQDRNILVVMEEWVDRQPDAPKSVRLAIRNARLAGRLSFWGLILLSGVFGIAYFVVVYVVVGRIYGPMMALLALAGIILLILLEVFWFGRRKGTGSRGQPSA